MTNATSPPLTLDMIREIVKELKAHHLPLDIRITAEPKALGDKFEEYRATIEVFLNNKTTP